MDELKKLIVAEAKRVIEILEVGDLEPDRWGNVPDRKELVSKMAELRRDTVRLEKKLYGGRPCQPNS